MWNWQHSILDFYNYKINWYIPYSTTILIIQRLLYGYKFTNIINLYLVPTFYVLNNYYFSFKSFTTFEISLLYILFCFYTIILIQTKK